MRTPYPLWILGIPVIIYFFLQTGKIHPPHYKLTGPASRPDSVIVHPEPLVYPTDSWPYFLQHLPTKKGPVLDFKGNPVSNQEKHFEILTYDVGTADLQQCADALMRIRAEYLYTQKKYSSIGFHFNSGLWYTWTDYLQGIRPVFINRKQTLSLCSPPMEISHPALRNYLDIVYAYANTVSLCRELQSTTRMEPGTVIIYPGNPGHCCMIIDAGVNAGKDTVFKLVEGYMPAQSIYVLSNPYEPTWSPWYHLGKGDISTASCTFRTYYLRKFE